MPTTERRERPAFAKLFLFAEFECAISCVFYDYRYIRAKLVKKGN